MHEIKKEFKDKKILVTGGTGSVGSEIVRRVMKYEPDIVRVLSNDEAGLFNLQQELNGLEGHKKVRYLLGDIRIKERLKMAAEDADIIFHAAALKHVPICEYNPFEAVNTNVLGTQNAIDAALANNVNRFIFISTDKAVNPLSVMGATKLLAERLVIAANYYKGVRKTKFSVARFGNILNSRGSIIPVVREQIVKGGAVTITDPNMTRFVASVQGCVDFIIKVATKSRGGEIFVLKMPAVRIADLVEVLIEELAPNAGKDAARVKREIIGPRIREKFHEELITEDEAEWLYEDNGMYAILYPIERTEGIINPNVEGFQKVESREKNTIKSYSSNNTQLLNKKEIYQLLRSTELFK